MGGKIMLKLILKELNGRAWTGFMWLSLGTIALLL
jgi:hypothetical protein